MNTAMQYLQQALALSNQMLACISPDKLTEAQALGVERDRLLKKAFAELDVNESNRSELQAVIQDIMAMDEKLKQASERLARQMTKADDTPNPGEPHQARQYQKRAQAYGSQTVKKT